MTLFTLLIYYTARLNAREVVFSSSGLRTVITFYIYIHLCNSIIYMLWIFYEGTGVIYLKHAMLLIQYNVAFHTLISHFMVTRWRKIWWTVSSAAFAKNIKLMQKNVAKINVVRHVVSVLERYASCNF